MKKIASGLAAAALWMGALSANAIVDGSQVQGAHGVIYVRGALTESACRLEMPSAWQTVDLGNISTGQLLREGSGTPVALRLWLQDCRETPATARDSWNGNQIWNPKQPAVTATFYGVTDPHSPGLLQVNGASGLALAISDARGRDVRIGSRGAPLALTPGQNALTWYITPKRTERALRAGAFSAQVNVQLDYD